MVGICRPWLCRAVGALGAFVSQVHSLLFAQLYTTILLKPSLLTSCVAIFRGGWCVYTVVSLRGCVLCVQLPSRLTTSSNIVCVLCARLCPPVCVSWVVEYSITLVPNQPAAVWLPV